MRTRTVKAAGLFMAVAIVGAACASDDPVADPTDDMTEGVSSAEICDADGLVAAVEGGPSEGTLAGMADDPVGTAASSNPVLTTLVTAVQAAGLVDTLNSAEALTVFAPTDCAFAALDEDTLNAALADPEGLLTQVLGFHVLTERLGSADLQSQTYTTFTGEELSVEVNGDAIRVGGQANVVVPDIMTDNATVFLIDTVMIPGAEAADSSTICDPDGLVAAVEGGPSEGTLAGMADDPVGTAASSNPVLTTLVTAVQAAGLVDTLNGAEALTVFAPTDCAFAALDEDTLNAALADPEGLLTQVLGFHVLTERLGSDELQSQTYTTFTGAELQIEVDGDTIRVGGQANVLVPDIMTDNATVYLIDTVMLPPS